MKLLRDTCALLWLVDAREELSDAAIEALSAEDAHLFVSAISAFEIAVKVRKGKLALTQPPRDWFKAAVLTTGARSATSLRRIRDDRIYQNSGTGKADDRMRVDTP